MLVLAVLSTFALGAQELTEANFDQVVHESGKGAFVKFLAPWWGHCKNMKAAWDQLADATKDGDLVTVADVDCTAAGKSLCTKVGVRGYPTIKYWLAGDSTAQDYRGGRSFSDLEGFAKKTFQKPCNVVTEENCSAVEKTYLDSVKGKDASTEKTKKEAQLKEAQAGRDAAQKKWETENKEAQEKEKKLKGEISLLQRLHKASGAKDEL